MKIQIQGIVKELIAETEKSLIFLVEDSDGCRYSIAQSKPDEFIGGETMKVGQDYDITCKLHAVKRKNSTGRVFVDNRLYTEVFQLVGNTRSDK